MSAAAGRPGDALLLSGPIGLHGTTVLSLREELGFEADIASDTRPLHRLVRTMVERAGGALHAVRDPTRGGLASALNEIARALGVGIVLEESAVPAPPPDAPRPPCIPPGPLLVHAGEREGRSRYKMKRNVGTSDRVIRAFLIAPVAVVLAALAGWTTGWAIVALVVAAIMLGTAAIGFCPLYALLGINTARRRRPAHV